MDRHAPHIIGLVFAAVGLVFTSIGGLLWADATRFAKEALRTDVEVVEIIEKRDEDGVTYAPVFEARRDGRVIRHSSSVSSNPPAHALGDKVLGYIGDNDRLETPASLRTRKLIAWIFGGIGLLFIGIGSVVAFRGRA